MTLNDFSLVQLGINSAGFVALFFSVFIFGSINLAVKKFETGDGMFYQLTFAAGVWAVGFVVNCFRCFPKFYPLPLLGGFLWATGNLSTVPIIKLIGIGLGSLIWNSMILIIGWAVARFGFFGVNPEIPFNIDLNYAGVAMTVISGIFYLFIKVDYENRESANEERQRLLGPNRDEILYEEERVIVVENQTSFIENLNPNIRRLLGVGLASIAGVLFAFTFTPTLYTQDNYPDASKNSLDHIFSLYTGILISSLFYFTIYCLIKRNNPQVFPNAILPGLTSGSMWGVAVVLFSIANNALTEAVTFPIVSSVPSGIAALWGIFLFKEIKGKKI